MHALANFANFPQGVRKINRQPLENYEQSVCKQPVNDCVTLGEFAPIGDPSTGCGNLHHASRKRRLLARLTPFSNSSLIIP